jgi:hypothetical protein
MRCRPAVAGLWAVWATRSVVQALWTGASRPQGGTVHSLRLTTGLQVWPQALDVRHTRQVADRRVPPLPVPANAL